jgi:phosphoglycerate dehydrogenase-like enzyme
MSFKILLLAPDVDPSWPEKIRRAVPGVVVNAFADPKDAVEDIVDADATYGTVPPELLARATKLRWICADRAGLGGTWFYDELVKGDVIVTNMRGQLQRASCRPRRRIPARLRPPLRSLPAAKAVAAGS